jgi:two-component system LytT family response regulator
MSDIAAIIIDDEEHNRNVLHTLLKKHCPLINVVAEAIDVDDAFEKINQLNPQLIFLDIKMPNKSGFDLLRLFDNINFEVIFVSAFNEYAITAFDFNALGYILKPIDYMKLIGVVDKAIVKIATNSSNSNIVQFIKTLESKNNLVNKITLHHKEKVVFVNISDIISVEANDGVCELKLIDNACYFSSKDLKLFEAILVPVGNFIRVNKSVIININFIKSYNKGDVCVLEMNNGISHEVSRRKKTEVLNKVKTL